MRNYWQNKEEYLKPRIVKVRNHYQSKSFKPLRSFIFKIKKKRQQLLAMKFSTIIIVIYPKLPVLTKYYSFGRINRKTIQFCQNSQKNISQQ